MQISPTALFCVGLITLCVGYIFVELLRGDKYFLRNSLKRNNNYRLDRVIHYIIRGVLINIVFFYMNFYVGNLPELANSFTLAGKLASILGPTTTSVQNIKMIMFAIGYFILLLAVMGCIFCIVKYIPKMFSGKSKKKNQNN
ncbi:MAG: hypothetical protein WC010_02595 [Candidatus Absconditabacterales bacterium]